MNSLKMIELSLTDVVIRMALAVVFGTLIGLERSIKRKGFGISSNAILCLVLLYDFHFTDSIGGYFSRCGETK